MAEEKIGGLRIVATSEPFRLGHQFTTHDGKKLEFIRRLTTKQVYDSCPQLYSAIVRDAQVGTEVFWYEYKVVSSSKKDKSEKMKKPN